jgi:hypothetical protein
VLLLLGPSSSFFFLLFFHRAQDPIVINIEEEDAGLAILMQDIDAVISPGANEAKLKQHSVHTLIPSLRRLFQPIQCLQKQTDIVLHTRLDKSIRLLHVQLLLQVSIEKGTVNIHLVYVPVVLSCKRKQNANGLELGHWSKHLMEVCTLSLLIALHNKASLVLGDVPSRVALVCKQHTQQEHLAILRTGHKLPDLALMDHVYLLLSSTLPHIALWMQRNVAHGEWDVRIELEACCKR